MKVTMKELFEAGAHFGHQTQRWNPKMAPYIFTAKNKVHIIDLAITEKKLEEAGKAVGDIAKDGGTILFVGTKKQAQMNIKKEAEKCNMPYVSERWLGGTLTNFQTVLSRAKYFKDLKRSLIEDTDITKKEKLKIEKEVGKLEANLGGILDMKRKPDMIYIVDIQKEATALREATKIGIPIVAIVDTNVNPELVTYPIPANDDAVKSTQIITGYISNVISDNFKEKVIVEDSKKEEKKISLKKEKEKGKK